MKTMAAHHADAAVLEAAAALAQAIQASAEWQELLNVQEAAQADTQFAHMVARHNELSRLQNSARSGGQGLDGKLLVEFIALRDQVQRHELHVRQQEAGSAVVELLRRINGKISADLGFDFASNASPRRGGCCG
jgi:cell fate (sporulation/competence/biofilm development) regulator YlbF (YheA/YmcA/DUF963 family)